MNSEFSEDKCEIHIASQGGAYGECIVIHIGDNNWVVVDSCRDKDTREALPIKILNDRKVKFDDVALIVCTHWHKDHTNGISDLLEICPNAKFAFARPDSFERFAQFIEYDYLHKSEYGNDVTGDFQKCLHTLKKTNKPIRVSCDQLLLSRQLQSLPLKVYSLSPSQKANSDFEFEISRLKEKQQYSNVAIQRKSPNDISVVLLFEIGYTCFLLGADLEVKKDNDDYGWLNITRKSEAIRGANKSVLFKIPHHGSKNGYHEEIWNKLLIQNPDGVITPNSRSDLPSEGMVNTYSSLTARLHMTAEPKSYRKPKKRSRDASKTINELNPSLKEIKRSFGIVSCYFDVKTNNPSLNITYKGEAYHQL
jgi:hypothetical protein